MLKYIIVFTSYRFRAIYCVLSRNNQFFQKFISNMRAMNTLLNTEKHTI